MMYGEAALPLGYVVLKFGVDSRTPRRTLTSRTMS